MPVGVIVVGGTLRDAQRPERTDGCRHVDDGLERVRKQRGAAAHAPGNIFETERNKADRQRHPAEGRFFRLFQHDAPVPQETAPPGAPQGKATPGASIWKVA